MQATKYVQEDAATVSGFLYHLPGGYLMTVYGFVRDGYTATVNKPACATVQYLCAFLSTDMNYEYRDVRHASPVIQSLQQRWRSRASAILIYDDCYI